MSCQPSRRTQHPPPAPSQVVGYGGPVLSGGTRGLIQGGGAAPSSPVRPEKQASWTPLATVSHGVSLTRQDRVRAAPGRPWSHERQLSGRRKLPAPLALCTPLTAQPGQASCKGVWEHGSRKHLGKEGSLWRTRRLAPGCGAAVLGPGGHLGLFNPLIVNPHY